MKDYKLPENKTSFVGFRLVSRTIIKFHSPEGKSLWGGITSLYLTRRYNGDLALEINDQEKDQILFDLSELS